MTLFADLLTGKFFRFRLASGTDVLAGTSNKVIVTPKSLKDAGVVPSSLVGSIPFVLSQDVYSSSTVFALGSTYGILPPAASNLIAKFHIYGKVDFNCAGEIGLWDVATGNIVNGSVVSFNVNSYQIRSSNTFTIIPGRVYTFAIRRTSFQAGFIYLRCATLTTV
jgi:hypothetical protein